jgi:FkbM family methyltransferase
MLSSFTFLFKASFNKKYPLRALSRFLVWKLIRLLKLQNLKVKFWKNCYLYITHDSFQSMWLMYNYIVDWEEFLFIHYYLRKNSIVFDIGSNMGFYTIWMSRSLGELGEIHSFEPDTKNFNRLSQNILINQFNGQFIPNKYAVSSKNGTMKMTIGFDGENHLVDSNFGGVSSLVNVVCLDEYCNQHDISKIDFIKIDVEGFELDVLKGGINLLTQKNIDVIQLELNGTLINSGTTKQELISFVESIGYQFCIYDFKINKIIPFIVDDERENYFITNNLENVNKILSENKIWKEDIMSL